MSALGALGSLRARLVPLAAVAIGAMVAGAAGLLPRWPGLIHFVALPPFDLMTDLRTALVHATGVPSFVAAVVLSLVVRSVVLASLLGDVRGLFRHALRFYAVVLPFAFVAAALLYAAGATLFYGLFWFGTIATLLVVGMTAALPWSSDAGLGSAFAAAARRGFRAGTIGAYLAVLFVLGFVADVTRPVGPVVLVPVSAAATVAAVWLLTNHRGYRLARRGLAALPAAGIAALLLLAYLGPAKPPAAPPPAQPRDGSIMLMSGIDSASGSGAILEIDPHYMGWTCPRTFYYSYAGPGRGQPRRSAQCPIEHGAPYGPLDTLRSRTELVPWLEAQAEEMVPPGVVAGHSQGVWLLWAAAADDRLPNVDTIVLVGAFPDNPISYPRLGERAPGWVGRVVLELARVVPRPGGTSVFEPDSPLGREWLGHPHAIERTLHRPLPGDVRALSVPSAFDLPLMAQGPDIARATNTCPIPVIHPNLPYSSEFQRAVVRFVEGGRSPPCPVWREAIGPLFRHFTAPPSG